jgi:hypothetical protein
VIDNDFIPVLSFPEPSGISTIEFIVYKIKGLFIRLYIHKIVFLFMQYINS